MGKVRVDVTGYGDEFSQHVEVDTEKVVSSIKVDVADHKVEVYYKRSDNGEPLNLDSDLEGMSVTEADETIALTGVVAPVDERVTATEMETKTETKETDLDEKGTTKNVRKSRATSNPDSSKVSSDKNSAVDPDGNTAKVKTDETLPDA